MLTRETSRFLFSLSFGFLYPTSMAPVRQRYSKNRDQEWTYSHDHSRNMYSIGRSRNGGAQ